MKQGLLASYISGITDSVKGERYKTIFWYFAPEYITNLLLYSLPFLLDAYFVSELKVSANYQTLGITNNLIHFLIKVSEGLSVGAMVMTGQFNGMGDYKDVGRSLRDAFWVAVIVGICTASILFFGASWIYYWYQVPEELIPSGVPLLRLHAISVFLMFLYMAIIGFLRGLKNTKTPMQTFVLGTLVFVICDYLFIFGGLGIAPMGLQGSAYASIVKYAVMLVAVLMYILFNKDLHKYGISLFAHLGNKSHMYQLCKLSWPVVVDKATMALSYIWLCRMINPMGTCSIGTYCVIKDMERFAFLPAIAFAQVITFLVSNDYGKQDWQGIKSNIKKVMFLASLLVGAVLIVFAMIPESIIGIFDKTGEFVHLAAKVFPLLSILVFFDISQIILSGALRGAGNVRTVMYVRLLVCFGYFIPVSWIFANIPIENDVIKFMLIYGSFYFGNALMSIFYITRFRGEEWKKQAVSER